MQEFKPGPYTEIASTATGIALWEFMNQAETLVILQTTTANRRPAIEGIQEQLWKQFGKAIKADLWLRMINRMLRQVMEQNGYKREPRPMKIIDGKLFTTGTRYQPSQKPAITDSE
ncbi:hypothetical protein [Methylomonas sp. AM2-LC]|uniref:hypothetical protein n=1 Tax=Methylomonas sp. AM2-LC TaxID=3153301 RepID=UPI00326783E2